MATTTITDELPPWSSIREHFRGQRDLGLLLGNGASQAIWHHFGYASLYTIACAPERHHPLTSVDQAFFEEMETRNFGSPIGIGDYKNGMWPSKERV